VVQAARLDAVRVPRFGRLSDANALSGRATCTPPLVLPFTWSVDGGALRTGEVTLTLDADGMLVVSGGLRVPVACGFFKLSNLEMRLDPEFLPAFRPTGTADLDAVADNPWVVLDGPVTFDGAGRAVVDGIVENYGAAHDGALTATLE